ncbi:ankyrin repeat-containing domain protein [Poronia punctata]|nr:ankyrin repeat-containing domain protein [Poronia punctata]
MSLQRSATRRAGPGPAREKKDYSVAEQGMKELYPLDKNNIAPEIDIVLVPGLGAHPEESWKSETTKFNWATEALVKDFPKSRVLLYRYQSAWTGALKVKQFMGNIAMTLLVCLQSVRKKCQRRPIVFIGHSMGGLVIAKAVTIADSRRDKFPVMFEAIAAAVFFGTPFGGAPVASVAAMYAHVAEKVGQATSSKLLDLMKEGDEGLRELKNEFMRLAGKINPKIELLCFYEEQPTDFSKMAGLPALYGLAKLVIPKQYQEFVSRDSATLPSIDEFGLACNHRDLVKFDGHKDPRWAQVVRDHLKKIIHGAQLAVKNRLNSVRDIDRTMITSIMEALEGAQVQKKRNLLRQNFTPSSWITTEPEYTEWLGEDQRDQKDAEAEHEQGRKGDCLWVRGPEGRGKTSASMAAVEKIETLIRHIEERDTGQDPILLAYFFCDTTQDYNTAEDVLKSIVRQLIRQQETLAPYAKQFMKKKGNEGGKSQAQVTVENLWQTLQDMLTDEFIGRKVIFVLNNVHCLPEDADSTVKLMKFLNAEMQNMNAEETKSRVATRWFITSREAHNVQQALKMDGVRLVDLEDDKYGNQVRDALRSHARQKILTLEQSKNYNKALAYFASSLIGRRAQNTQWIDITCMQLEELPQTNSDLPVRRALETMPQDLKSLLNRSWSQVFRSNEQATEKIKEMLRALVLTYEDPTEDELGILAGLCSNEEEKAELHELIDRCRPLLTIKRDEKVSFMNIVVKTHLLENAKELLGLSTEEIKWQHGVLSLRSFAHLKERYGNEPEPEPTTEQPAEPNDANGTQGEEAADETASHVGQDTDEVDPENPAWTDANDDEISQDGSEAVGGYDDDLSDWDSDDDDEFDEAAETSDSPLKALPYMIKNWLRHASKATLEIAEDLSLEVDFWKLDSHLRRCWLDDYCKVTNTFEYFDHTTLTGLHVAASVGFQQLVAALIRNSEPAKSEITVRDAMVNAPLHFAAHFGRPNIVKELLDRGAPIDDGIEIGEQTPLHMAAFGGHVEVMKKLLLRGANPNAASNDIGPVVNAAISSGNRAAVELLVNHGVSLTLDREDIISPLALSALLSDVSMFEYLIQQYADKLPAVEYSKALVKAAEAGRIEVFNKLLEFHHAPEYFQSALEAAVEDYNWDITTAILERQPGLDCNNLFYTVATCSEPQDNMLEAAWAYGGSISPETLGRSLYDATDREKDNTVKLLLEKCGANPNATGEEYGNALTAAAYDGTLHIVEMLLEAGADVNAPEGYALQAAAAEGHYDVVEELIKRGANVNALAASDNFEAGTALQGATEAGQTEIVRLLLDAGADPNHGAGEDAPPIVAAARRCEEDILKLLLAKKPKLDVFGGPDKSTPLINAAAYMPISSLELLLDAGADINLPDNDGDTALIVASGRGDEEVVAFLLGHGADIMHTSFRGENALQSALKEENTDCLRVLIDHASLLFNAIKKSMDSGPELRRRTTRERQRVKQRVKQRGNAFPQ